MQIPSRVSHTSRPFGKVTEIPLTFPPVHKPKGYSTSHPRGIYNAKKKYHPPYSTTHQLFFGFTPHQSPPFYLDLANRRNLVLQLHTPHSSLLRFKIFLCLWTLVKFFPIIMRSAVHNLQTFIPAILTRLMVFERQRMSTLMLVRHHSTTSAFVLNRRCFMWAKSRIGRCLFFIFSFLSRQPLSGRKEN